MNVDTEQVRRWEGISRGMDTCGGVGKREYGENDAQSRKWDAAPLEISLCYLNDSLNISASSPPLELLDPFRYFCPGYDANLDQPIYHFHLA